jgi:hypothetical protein
MSATLPEKARQAVRFATAASLSGGLGPGRLARPVKQFAG